MKNTKFYLIALLLGFFVALTACSSTATEKSTGEYIDDTVITTKVKAAFVERDDLDANEIQVETFKGTVQLSGFVSDAEDVGNAERVAKDVNGVKSVKNDIRVK